MANVFAGSLLDPLRADIPMGPDAPIINSVNPIHTVGAIAVRSTGTIYRYCQAGDAWIAADDSLTPSSDTQGFRLSPSGTTAEGVQCAGASVAAVTDEYFSWAVVYGLSAAMTCATGKAITQQLAIVCCTTSACMENYGAAHTAAGPGGVAGASIASTAAGVVIILAF
jgi:hypothetical protein